MKVTTPNTCRHIPLDEQWLDVAGYIGLYQVSNLGRIRSLDRVVRRKDGRHQSYAGRILSPFHGTSNRYYQVQLSKDGSPKKMLVHRIVAAAFIHEIPDGYEVNHIDGDVQNNAACNLAIVLHQQNIDHSIAMGLKDDYGEKHTNSKLTNQEAAYIRSQYRDGVKQVDLARMFGISKQAVNNIVHNKSYIR